MSVELLREAAALMRERAEACPDWNATWGENAARDCFDGMDFAQHIASWHPAVALAVARLLEKQAHFHDEFVSEGIIREHDLVSGDLWAADIAKAYLGRTS